MLVTMNGSTHQSSFGLRNSIGDSELDNLQTYVFSYGTIAVLALVTNSFLCVYHTFYKRTRNVIFLNHYVANVFQAISMVAITVGVGSDKYLTFPLNFSFCSSVLTLPVMSATRLSRTPQIGLYVRFFSGKLPHILAAIWCLAVGVAIPPFLGWGTPPLFLRNPVQVSLSYAVLFWFAAFALPFTVITAVNVKVCLRVVTYGRHARGDFENQNQRTKRKREAKWILVLQIVSFATCIAPVAVGTIVASSVPTKKPTSLAWVANYLALSYCFLSPFLHGFVNREVRRAVTCCFRKRKFVLQGRRRKIRRTKKHLQLNRGRYRVDPFVINDDEKHFNDKMPSVDLNHAYAGRLVRFLGSRSYPLDRCNDNSKLEQYVFKEKTRLTTEVAPIRRHSTLRTRDEALRVTIRRQTEVDTKNLPEGDHDDIFLPIHPTHSTSSTQYKEPRGRTEVSTKVRFNTDLTEKQARKYILTPSVKRMRRIKKDMFSISLTDLQCSVASLPDYEVESQRHLAPHFTNYSDPLRSSGFRQVVSRRVKTTRTCSVNRCTSRASKTKGFIQRRCSTEGDDAIRSAN